MSEADTLYDVIVIGGGMAGLTAARQAAARGLSVGSIDAGGHMGGLIMNVNKVDGVPGPDAEPVSGVELAAIQLEALLEHGVELIPETATGLTLEGDIKVVATDSGVNRAKNVVLASGASLKKLGVPGEERLFGRGVSQCAGCDAAFFKDQHVVVVGGGDSALQEALHIADYASAITIVARGDALRARESYVARVMEHPKFEVRLSTTVSDIVGTESVEGVRLASTTGDAEELACAGVFVFIGLAPNSGLLPSEMQRDDGGAVVTDESYQTNVPGIYAIGAVRAGYSGQLVDAVAEGERVVV